MDFCVTPGATDRLWLREVHEAPVDELQGSATYLPDRAD